MIIVVGLPWCRKHGKKHGFPMLPLLSHAVSKSMGKHGNIFQATSTPAWISMETMGHHLVILIAWKIMGIMILHFLMISDSMGKHGKHSNSLFS